MELREKFANHKANIIVNEEHYKILDWKEPGTSAYFIRYVITDSFMSIVGDVGSAVFRFTWNPTFEENWKIDIDYFKEKMMSSSCGEFTWCDDDARADLEENIKELEADDYPLNDDEIEYIESAIQFSGMDGVVGYNRFCQELYEYMEDAERYDSFGKRTPIQIELWLLGLQMASDQLNNKD